MYLPLLAAGLVGVVAVPLGRALPPATAARLLTAAGVLTAAASSFVLSVLTFALVAESAPVAALGSWSTVALDAANPVPDTASTVAAVALAGLTVLAARALVRRVRAEVAARQLCGALGGGPGTLVVVDDPAVDVFTVPARHGRIVASRGLLSSLDADERRAVLAHETAHLGHRHHRYRLAVELAAALNPLLRPLVPAVGYATERWADEAAAGAVGDRAVVARALARTGLRAARSGRSAQVPGGAVHATAGGSVLVRRVEALLAPAPRSRPLLVVAVAVVLAVTVAASVETQRDAEQMFEHASPTADAPHLALPAAPVRSRGT